MGLAHVIGPGEREWFRRCRRAWDFGSPNRRNLEPQDSSGVDLAGAVRLAMAVWYFPGMWEWPRAIVQPRAMQAFEEAAAGGPASQEDIESGRAMLERYFAWAPTVDAFAPVRVEADFEAGVPDVRTPGSELVDADGQHVRYHDRIHLLIVDSRDTYWVMEHRLASDSWADRDELLLAERPLSATWGWEHWYLGMEFAGTVHNELRLDGTAGPADGTAGADREAGPAHDAPGADREAGPAHDAPGADREAGPAHDAPGADGKAGPADGDPGEGRAARHPRSRDWARSRAAGRAAQAVEDGTDMMVEEGGGWFRRTWIRRTRAEVAGVGARLSAEVLDMLDPDLRLYPSPTPEHCGRCDFRAPCLAMNEGTDVEAVLDHGYRLRRDRGPEEGRLGGGSWSMNRGAAPPPGWRSPPR